MKNCRILKDWNNVIYTDDCLALPTLKYYGRVSNGISLKGDNGLMYTVRFTQHGNRRNKPIAAYFIEETNSETGLVHQYRALYPCRLFCGKEMLDNEITFITFEQTVVAEAEYADYECTNWSIDGSKEPAWEY